MEKDKDDKTVKLCLASCPKDYMDYDNQCRTECPDKMYLEKGLCYNCHESCLKCTGPFNLQC